MLTANDPHVPNNITKYNFKERTYKVDPPGQGDLLAIHFSYDGCALHKVREHTSCLPLSWSRQADSATGQRLRAEPEHVAVGDGCASCRRAPRPRCRRRTSRRRRRTWTPPRR